MTFWQRNQLKFAPFYFLAPGLILFLIYVIYPIIDSIWVSFHEWNGMPKDLLKADGTPKNWKWVGFGNYIDLYENEKCRDQNFRNFSISKFSKIFIEICMKMKNFEIENFRNFSISKFSFFIQFSMKIFDFFRSKMFENSDFWANFF